MRMHRNMHYLLFSLLPAARLTECSLQSVSCSVFYVAYWVFLNLIVKY
jgi:hypothetical protein